MKDTTTLFTADTGIRVITGTLGAKLTTMQVGGPLAAFVEPNSQTELQLALAWLHDRQQPFRILGAGSNLVIADAGITDWVIRLGKGFRAYEILKILTRPVKKFG
jgi:UDP-N-acetylenolpyruvoylglucosamine reductase